MNVFVTGASGFVGSAVVRELLAAGHAVVGMARSESGAQKIVQAGATVHMADLEDVDSICSGLTDCDAVIHTAFNHDFTQFKANCELDRRVITAIGKALAGSGRPLVVTSGTGLLRSETPITEDVVPPSSEVVPRAATEEAASLVAAMGVPTYVVRLPPTVHGAGDHGFVPMLINIAREKGRAAYVGEGLNTWAAVHRFDAARLYRAIVEQKPAQRIFHAAAEPGILFRDIAAAIGSGLEVPVVSISPAEAEAHFGWFAHFAAMGSLTSSKKTQELLGWTPVEAGLLEDLASGVYFQ